MHRQCDQRHVHGCWHRPPPKMRYDSSKHCVGTERVRERKSARAQVSSGVPSHLAIAAYMAKQPHSEARGIQGVHPTQKRERKPGCKLHLPLAACSICKSSPTLWFSAPAHPFPRTSTCGHRAQCTSHRGRHRAEGDKMMRGTLDSAGSSVRQTRQARAAWHDAWECDGTRVPANPCDPVPLPLRQGPGTAASCARQQRASCLSAARLQFPVQTGSAWLHTCAAGPAQGTSNAATHSAGLCAQATTRPRRT
jgi:hypothetical protein